MPAVPHIDGWQWKFDKATKKWSLHQLEGSMADMIARLTGAPSKSDVLRSQNNEIPRKPSIAQRSIASQASSQFSPPESPASSRATPATVPAQPASQPVQTAPAPVQHEVSPQTRYSVTQTPQSPGPPPYTDFPAPHQATQQQPSHGIPAASPQPENVQHIPAPVVSGELSAQAQLQHELRYSTSQHIHRHPNSAHAAHERRVSQPQQPSPPPVSPAQSHPEYVLPDAHELIGQTPASPIEVHATSVQPRIQRVIPRAPPPTYETMHLARHNSIAQDGPIELSAQEMMRPSQPPISNGRPSNSAPMMAQQAHEISTPSPAPSYHSHQSPVPSVHQQIPSPAPTPARLPPSDHRTSVSSIPQQHSAIAPPQSSYANPQAIPSLPSPPPTMPAQGDSQMAQPPHSYYETVSPPIAATSSPPPLPPPPSQHEIAMATQSAGSPPAPLPQPRPADHNLYQQQSQHVYAGNPTGYPPFAQYAPAGAPTGLSVIAQPSSSTPTNQVSTPQPPSVLPTQPPAMPAVSSVPTTQMPAVQTPAPTMTPVPQPPLQQAQVSISSQQNHQHAQPSAVQQSQADMPQYQVYQSPPLAAPQPVVQPQIHVNAPATTTAPPPLHHTTTAPILPTAPQQAQSTIPPVSPPIPLPTAPPLTQSISAPQVVQSSVNHKTGMLSKAKITALGKGVGNWAGKKAAASANWVEKHPKAALAGAAAIEIVGVENGFDVIKAATSMMNGANAYNKYKRGQNQQQKEASPVTTMSQSSTSEQQVQQTTQQSQVSSPPQVSPPANTPMYSPPTIANVQPIATTQLQGVPNPTVQPQAPYMAQGSPPMIPLQSIQPQFEPVQTSQPGSEYTRAVSASVPPRIPIQHSPNRVQPPASNQSTARPPPSALPNTAPTRPANVAQGVGINRPPTQANTIRPSNGVQTSAAAPIIDPNLMQAANAISQLVQNGDHMIQHHQQHHSQSSSQHASDHTHHNSQGAQDDSQVAQQAADYSSDLQQQQQLQFQQQYQQSFQQQQYQPVQQQYATTTAYPQQQYYVQPQQTQYYVAQNQPVYQDVTAIGIAPVGYDTGNTIAFDPTISVDQTTLAQTLQSTTLAPNNTNDASIYQTAPGAGVQQNVDVTGSFDTSAITAEAGLDDINNAVVTSGGDYDENYDDCY